MKWREDPAEYGVWRQQDAKVPWHVVNNNTVDRATVLVRKSFDSVHSMQHDADVEDTPHSKDDEDRPLDKPD